MFIKFWYTLIFLFLTESHAYAYLEPGTLTIILQFIVAAFAAIISYLTFYYQKVKNFLIKILKKKKDDKKN